MELEARGFLTNNKTNSSVFMAAWSYLAKCFVTVFKVILPIKCFNTLQIFFTTLPRDVRTALAGIAIVLKSAYYKRFNCTIISEFKKLVRKHPNKPCFRFNDQIWTFQEIDDFSDKVAQVFHNAGYKKGDVVSLFVTNRPEYVCIWLGLGKIGVISSLINTNLTLKSLHHCITTSSSKAIVFSEDLMNAILDIRVSLESTIRLFQLDGVPKEGISSLDNAIKFSKPVQSEISGNVNHYDHFLYIFTSGTTGFPKAAIMPHSRFLLMSAFSNKLLSLSKNDIVYNPLPLYHTAGGLLGVSTGILNGATVVLRTKFSATSYIPECTKYKCTVAQYIGEICRYVLSVPPKPSDKEHNIRLMVGNGLRPSLWAQFVERFNIKNVMEIYGSTEGNLIFANVDNKIGAVGSIPRFWPKCYTRKLGAIIKVDQETMIPKRNEEGFCIECEPGETGMFIGIISHFEFKEFYGYLDKKATSKNYIYNVFRKGDKAFVSGDLLEMDELGYLYFKDRTGDTFRWKGENVATSEVEAIISNAINLSDCCVYGVQVGDLEGRAGMAAIVDNGQIDLKNLTESLDKLLPKYAQPIFIRFLQEMEMTGTFKLKKINLQKEGFNPNIIKDPLYVKQNKDYIPLTKDLYDKILSGLISI